MSDESDEAKKVLAHHEQLPLCTTRLPYRQGRKLTAVKVYTINNESNHLLVFGVPSLNLRQETKSLFIKFGKLLHFTIATNHPAEDFTETYHARYERIQSARIAKRMIDTKNFYGGSLHVCYAPEFESIEETRNKLLQRKKDVLFRLRNLQKEAMETSKSNNRTEIDITNNHLQNNSVSDNNTVSLKDKLSCNTDKDEFCSNTDNIGSKKMNMGENNIIYLKKHKRKLNKETIIQKKFKLCFDNNKKIQMDNKKKYISKSTKVDGISLEKGSLEVVDCTSIDKEIVSNINEALNYNRFGNEVIKKVEIKPQNSIVFHCNKKSC